MSSRSVARSSFGSNRSFAIHGNAVRNALNSRSITRALSNGAVLHNPNVRAQIAAGAAIAGWHGGGIGWWRHGNGGYGWVGPLFWPFAYYDLYDYTMWGDGYYASFWDYGYDDIYAGIFGPYGYDELTGYLPQRALPGPGSSNAPQNQLAQMCGGDSGDIAGLPIEQIREVIEPTDEQRIALDDLASASVTAAQNIKAACPTAIALTASGRLAFMQHRIEAMIAAVTAVQPPLEKFYALLNDEQKLRLNALGEDQRRKTGATRGNKRSVVQTCGVAPPVAMEWPMAEIDTRLHPTEPQRASLVALQDASAKASDMLKASCQPDDALTPPARLKAVGQRLDTMLQAVKMVRSALDDFYGMLSDEQKAQFEAIGPRRSA
jgi:hypothetical protein